MSFEFRGTSQLLGQALQNYVLGQARSWDKPFKILVMSPNLGYVRIPFKILGAGLLLGHALEHVRGRPAFVDRPSKGFETSSIGGSSVFGSAPERFRKVLGSRLRICFIVLLAIYVRSCVTELPRHVHVL